MSRPLERLSSLFATALLALVPSAIWWDVLGQHTPWFYRELTGGLLYLTDILLLLVIALFLVRWLRAEWAISLGPKGVLLALGALAGLASASVIWSPARGVAAEGAFRLVVLLALYVALVNIGPSNRVAAIALAVGAGVEGAVGIAQWLLQRPLGFAGFGETAALVRGPDEAWLRSGGLSPNPNILGGYLVVGILAGIGLPGLSGGWRLAQTLALGLSLAGLLATASRSAWLGLGAGLGVLLLGRPRPLDRRLLRVLTLPAVVFLADAVVFGDRLGRRVIGPIALALGFDPTAASLGEIGVLVSRLDTLKAAVTLTLEHPLGGVGQGNFAIAWFLRGQPEPSWGMYLPAHAVPLLVVGELGLAGAAAWAGLWAAVVVASRKGQATGEPWRLVWSSALTAIFAIGLLDYYPWGWQQGRLLFVVVLALWARTVGGPRSALAEG